MRKGRLSGRGKTFVLTWKGYSLSDSARPGPETHPHRSAAKTSELPIRRKAEVQRKAITADGKAQKIPAHIKSCLPYTSP